MTNPFDHLRLTVDLAAQEYAEVVAQRDALRVAAGPAPLGTEADAHVLHSLGVDGLVELVAALRRDYTRTISRLHTVAEAAHAVLETDRTSWSDEHAVLSNALAALDDYPRYPR